MSGDSLGFLFFQAAVVVVIILVGLWIFNWDLRCLVVECVLTQTR